MQQAYASILDLEPDIDLCGVTETAESFLEVLHETPCNLVVTDLSLPGMDGIAMIAHIRAERPELPVIVISAHEDPARQAQALQAGARAYLTKTNLVQQLAPTIRRVIGGPGGPRTAD